MKTLVEIERQTQLTDVKQFENIHRTALFRTTQVSSFPINVFGETVYLETVYSSVTNSIVSTLNNETNILINSVIVSGDNYTEVDSINECKSTEASFYFDKETLYIYINFDVAYTTDLFITAGILQGFTKYGAEYIDDRYYDSRVLSIPNIKKKRTRWNFDVLQNYGGVIKLANNDGFFDEWKDSTPLGVCYVKLGNNDTPYNELLTRKFLIDSVKLGENELTIKVLDFRGKISGDLLTETLNDTDFPNIKDDFIGQYKPLSWGNPRSVPTVPINSNIAQTNYTFLVSTNGSTVQTVYKNGISVSFTPVTNGFTLSNSIYDPTVNDEITADTLSTTANAVDILEDILINYSGISANEIDSSSFNAIKNITYDLAIFVNKKTQIKKIVPEILQSIAGYIYTDNNGLLALRSELIDRPINNRYFNEDVFNNLTFDITKKNVISSLTTAYDKGFSSGKYRRVADTSERENVKQSIGSYQDEEILSYIKTASSATYLSNTLLSKYKDIKPYALITLPYVANNLEVGDRLILNMDRLNKTWYGEYICEVYEVNYNDLTPTIGVLLIEPYIIEPQTAQDKEKIIVYNESVYLDTVFS